MEMKYKCPLCGEELVEWVGTKMYPFRADHGITLDCGNKGCPAQECFGHGKDAKSAYEIIIAKYGKKR